MQILIYSPPFTILHSLIHQPTIHLFTIHYSLLPIHYCLLPIFAYFSGITPFIKDDCWKDWKDIAE